VNGDAPAQPKKVFPGCCPFQTTDRGKCVPTEIMSQAQQDIAPQLTCATGSLCAPNLKATNPAAKFPTCRLPAASLACTPPILNLGCDGACVPDCLVGSDLSGFVARGSCAAGELCAPCVNPLDGTRTGSCD
jgi:hypothetical protein